MRKELMTAVLGVSLVGLPLFMGCNRTVSEDTTKKTDPDTGKTTVDQKKTEALPDGGTKTTVEHKVDKP